MAGRQASRLYASSLTLAVLRTTLRGLQQVPPMLCVWGVKQGSRCVVRAYANHSDAAPATVSELNAAIATVLYAWEGAA